MDFLDIEPAGNIQNDQWVGFLGLGNKKQKATAQNLYEADIQSKYPFSDNCAEQKALIAAMLDESKQTLVARNSAKKGKGRNDLTGKLRAFDQYIPAAVEYMKSTSCAIGSDQGDQNTGTGAGQKTNTSTQVPTTVNSNAKKYALIGLGVILIAGAGFFVVKKLTK